MGVVTYLGYCDTLLLGYTAHKTTTGEKEDVDARNHPRRSP
jgi:hypothetical protein